MAQQQMLTSPDRDTRNDTESCPCKIFNKEGMQAAEPDLCGGPEVEAGWPGAAGRAEDGVDPRVHAGGWSGGKVERLQLLEVAQPVEVRLRQLPVGGQVGCGQPEDGCLLRGALQGRAQHLARPLCQLAVIQLGHLCSTGLIESPKSTCRSISSLPSEAQPLLVSRTNQVADVIAPTLPPHLPGLCHGEYNVSGCHLVCKPRPSFNASTRLQASVLTVLFAVRLPYQFLFAYHKVGHSQCSGNCRTYRHRQSSSAAVTAY